MARYANELNCKVLEEIDRYRWVQIRVILVLEYIPMQSDGGRFITTVVERVNRNSKNIQAVTFPQQLCWP